GLKAPTHTGYILAGVGVMLIAIPFTGLLGELNRNIPFPKGMASWMHEQEVDAARTIQALLSRHTPGDLLLNLLCVAGFAAVGEELLFRGVVQRILIKLFKSPFVGILVSAALFSAMHMQFYGFFPRLALGILLGLIFWYSGSLWIAMLAHFVYDAVLIILAYNNPSMLAEENSLPIKNLILAGSISFLFVMMLLIWMRKKTVTTYASVYADDAVPVKNHPFDFDKNTPE
ncbi:MAG TPA: CPBP family intramembrane metalloprotease, partial [Chitinophagaceae bacterium]|nr:CPBP family intramembrane metalloprotease [Chitinophagaceae bacterium]HRG94049.1 CPBP family intramembrane metalloprotease [Chitinophagaceae bacterium]